jgi:hypothetical protein
LFFFFFAARMCARPMSNGPADAPGYSFVSLVSVFTSQIRELKELSLLRSTDSVDISVNTLRNVDQQLAEVEQKLMELKYVIAKEKQYIEKAEELQRLMLQQQTAIKEVQASIPTNMRICKPAPVDTNMPIPTKPIPKQDAPELNEVQIEEKSSSNSSSQQHKHGQSHQQPQTRSEKKVTSTNTRAKKKVKYVVPSINHVTKEELEACSGYMRGRLSPDKINNAIDEIQSLVQEKYRILALAPNKMGTTTRIKYNTYKALQQEAKGQIFFTEEDLRAAPSIKSDATGKSIMSILQTLGRLKVEGARQKRFVLVG